MGLEDSNNNSFFVINNGLDTSFSETPQTPGEDVHIHVGISPTVEPRTVQKVEEKAKPHPRTRGKRRLARLENPSSHLSLVPDNALQQKAPDQAEKADEYSEKIQRERKQKKSVDKVSQWLLQDPLPENLESKVNPNIISDPEHSPFPPAGSCSSASTIIRRAQPERNKETRQVKVFRFYSRRGKKFFVPPQHPVELLSLDPSPVDEEHIAPDDVAESSEPNPEEEDDAGVVGVVKIQPQVTNERSCNTSKDVSEESRASDRNADANEVGKCQEEQEDEGDVSSQAFNTAVLRLESKSTHCSRHLMQGIDSDLPEQAKEKRKSAAKRSARRKGKNAKPQNRKSERGMKPLVLVSALEGKVVSETTAQSRLGCGGEVQVQIEMNPSSKEAGAAVARTTRSGRAQRVAVEAQESSAGKRLNERAMSTRGPTAEVPCLDNDTLTKPLEEARTVLSDDVKQAKRNGCICDEDMGGIEKLVESPMTPLHSVTEVVPSNGSIVEVPNTVSPCEASAACFVPTTATTRSPTEAAVPSPAPESIIQPADRNCAPIEDVATQMECVEMGEDEGRSDSEVDTEQLMKTFKVAKRKSFHLGTPKRKPLCSALEVSEDGSDIPPPTQRKRGALTPPNAGPCISSDPLSDNRQGYIDNSVTVVVDTNGSMTPDGLVPPPVVESADQMPASGGLSAGSPVVKNTLGKRKAQRLESSSESEEEFLTLAEIFKSPSRHRAVQCNHLDGQAETQKGPGGPSGREEASVLAGPLAKPPACPPSPDLVESSQASVDLFDTPTECESIFLLNETSLHYTVTISPQPSTLADCERELGLHGLILKPLSLYFV